MTDAFKSYFMACFDQQNKSGFKFRWVWQAREHTVTAGNKIRELYHILSLSLISSAFRNKTAAQITDRELF